MPLTRLTSVPSWAEPAILLRPSYQFLLGVREDAGEAWCCLLFPFSQPKLYFLPLSFTRELGSEQNWCWGSCRHRGSFHASNHANRCFPSAPSVPQWRCFYQRYCDSYWHRSLVYRVVRVASQGRISVFLSSCRNVKIYPDSLLHERKVTRPHRVDC